MPCQTRRKQYVEVIATHHIDGSVRPQQIIFAAGPIYDIEDVKRARLTKSPYTFEMTTQYTVIIQGKETFLYEDCGRWFVLMKS
jgi:hypothetical protein